MDLLKRFLIYALPQYAFCGALAASGAIQGRWGWWMVIAGVIGWTPIAALLFLGRRLHDAREKNRADLPRNPG